MIQLISPSPSSFASCPSASFPSCIQLQHTCLPAILFYACLPACSFPPPLLVPPLPHRCLSELGLQVSSSICTPCLHPGAPASGFQIPQQHNDTSVFSPAPFSPHSSRLRDPTFCLASPLECLTGVSDVTWPKQRYCVSVPNILSPSPCFKEQKSHFLSCSESSFSNAPHPICQEIPLALFSPSTQIPTLLQTLI